MGFWCAFWAVCRTILFGAGVLLLILLVQPFAEPLLLRFPNTGVVVLFVLVVAGIPLLWLAHERIWGDLEKWRSGRTVSALLKKRPRGD